MKALGCFEIMDYMQAVNRITEHQAAFYAEHDGWPARIHVNYRLVCALAASPWGVHFKEDRWLDCQEGYFAHSVLIPEMDLPRDAMWSPRATVPDWSCEH